MPRDVVISTFAHLARKGLKQCEIAECLGLRTEDLANAIYSRRELLRVWIDCKPARHKAAEDRKRERRKVWMQQRRADPDKTPREKDEGGPISPALLAVAALATRAREQRETRRENERVAHEARVAEINVDAELLLPSLVKLADREGWVCVSEAGEDAGMDLGAAYRAARWLHDRGRFPWRLKMRDPKPKPKSKAVEETRNDSPDYSEEHGKFLLWRAKPTSGLTLSKAARDDVRRYVREWKARYRPGRVVTLTAAERKSMQQREYSRKRRLEVA